MRTVLKVSFKHILNGLISLIGIPHWLWILYTTYLMIKSWAFSNL
jgi:hypothetical protein